MELKIVARVNSLLLKTLNSKNGSSNLFCRIIRITMSQLVEMTGVSPSQIRYWEKKGYINSEQGGKEPESLIFN